MKPRRQIGRSQRGLRPIGMVLSAAFAGALAAQTTRPAERTPASRPAPPEEIAEIVRSLGRGSYRQRENAMRRLARIGPAAIPYLAEETDNPRAEVALAAGELIRELSAVFFCGTQIRLEAQPTTIRWDEPVRLRIRVQNRGPYDALLPWSERPTTSAPADRVATFFDVADFLEVTGPSGRPVEVRSESIGEDPAVERVVLKRADLGGEVSTLPPGREGVLDVPEFNRGWARFPLLTAGRYRIRFVYQPAWSRPEWIQEGIGRVLSEPIEIQVIAGAPDAVRTATAPMRVVIRRTGGHLIASLLNTWDRAQIVNLNLGADELSAQVRWTVGLASGEKAVWIETTASPIQEARWDPARLRSLAPAQTIEFARIAVDDVLAAARRELPEVPEKDLCVAARYESNLSRETLRRLGARARTEQDRRLAELADKLPLHIYAGKPGSGAVALSDLLKP